VKKKAVKKKREKVEQPVIKNQIRDKAAKNKEENTKDERRITNISEIKNKIRRNQEWLKLKREKGKMNGKKWLRLVKPGGKRLLQN